MLRGPLLLKIPRVSKSKLSLGGRAFSYQAPLPNQVTPNNLLLCCHRIHMLGTLLLIYQTDINLLHCSPVVWIVCCHLWSSLQLCYMVAPPWACLVVDFFQLNSKTEFFLFTVAKCLVIVGFWEFSYNTVGSLIYNIKLLCNIFVVNWGYV